MVCFVVSGPEVLSLPRLIITLWIKPPPFEDSKFQLQGLSKRHNYHMKVLVCFLTHNRCPIPSSRSSLRACFLQPAPSPPLVSSTSSTSPSACCSITVPFSAVIFFAYLACVFCNSTSLSMHACIHASSTCTSAVPGT